MDLHYIVCLRLRAGGDVGFSLVHGVDRVRGNGGLVHCTCLRPLSVFPHLSGVLLALQASTFQRRGGVAAAAPLRFMLFGLDEYLL